MKNQTKTNMYSKEIIVVTVEMGDGGAERVLSELMEAWVRKGYSVTLVQTRPDLYGHNYIIPNGVHNIKMMSRGKTKFIRYSFESISLLRILKKHPYATVVALVNAAIRIVGVCSFFVNNRIVFSERCDPRYTPESPLMRWLRDRLFCIADTCVFQTRQAMELFPEKVQKRGVVIPNPVNPYLPPPFCGIRKKVIVTACRLAPQKNLSMLIKAFVQLEKDYPDYKLEVYGVGKEQENLQQLIEQYCIEEKAHLMGHTSNIHQIMRECTMYVCTSDYEGLSNSLLEALALGLPVISTDHPIGGAREMITDQENGMLIPVGDVDALYKAMKYLIMNPEFAKKLGQNAAKIRDKWPVDRIAEQWLELF